VIGITPKSRKSNKRNVFDLDQHDLFGAQKQKEKKQIKEHFKTTQQNNINKTEDREEGVETLEMKTKL
jgi:hypothetical protein